MNQLLSRHFWISLTRKLRSLSIWTKQACLHIIASVFNLWSLLNYALMILFTCLINNTLKINRTGLHFHITSSFRVCLHWYIILTELMGRVWLIMHWLWIFNCSKFDFYFICNFFRFLFLCLNFADMFGLWFFFLTLTVKSLLSNRSFFLFTLHFCHIDIIVFW